MDGREKIEQAISGADSKDVEFEGLKGEILTYVDIDPEQNRILLTTESGRTILLHHEQDCCEYVRIESTDGGWHTLYGKPLVSCKASIEQGFVGSGDHKTDTDLIFRVNDAVVISRWVGESNGYYSEDVHITEFLKKEELADDE